MTRGAEVRLFGWAWAWVISGAYGWAHGAGGSSGGAGTVRDERRD
ncbi:hypothetical protein [Frankia gtarii]|nr:hypothetical protein [Frankia gtarii]